MRGLVVISIVVFATPASAGDSLPNPLGVADVVAAAKARRSEIVAARARARGAAQRPAVVSALDDPIVAAALDHVPFEGTGVDWNLTFEQRFPLSRVRGHRERGAEAGARRELAIVDRATRDVELEAAQRFWMLAEARAVAEIAVQQLAVAEQLVAAATARYTANAGTQADVLRAETERARLGAERDATIAEVRAAEAMLRASLAFDGAAPIPALDLAVPEGEPVAADLVARAAAGRPELRAGRAEVEQAEADVRVMRSMDAPMAMIRTGPAYTMGAGYGWMAMVAISVPLWRSKYRAQIAEARSMREMAGADLVAMEQMIEGQARAAREQVVAARARFRALRDDVVPRAEQTLAPALASYVAGQLPLVSVVEVAQALWMSRRELAMARTQLGVAWARLRRVASEEVTP